MAQIIQDIPDIQDIAEFGFGPHKSPLITTLHRKNSGFHGRLLVAHLLYDQKE